MIKKNKGYTLPPDNCPFHVKNYKECCEKRVTWNDNIARFECICMFALENITKEIF